MRAEILPVILQRLGIDVTTAQWNHEKNKITEHWTEHPTDVNSEDLLGNRVGRRVEVKVESGQSSRDTCSSLEPRTPQAHEHCDEQALVLVEPQPHQVSQAHEHCDEQALVLVEPQPHQVSQEQALALVLDVGGQQITVQQLRDNYIQTPKLHRRIIKLRKLNANHYQSVRRLKQVCQKKTKQIQVLKNKESDETELAMRGKPNANFTVGNHVAIALRRSIGHYGAQDFQFASLTPMSSWSVRKAECVTSGYVNNTQIGKIGSPTSAPHHSHPPDFRPLHIPAPRRCSNAQFFHGGCKIIIGILGIHFLGSSLGSQGLTQQKINK